MKDKLQEIKLLAGEELKIKDINSLEAFRVSF